MWTCDDPGCEVDVLEGEGVTVRGARLCPGHALVSLLDVYPLTDAEAQALALLLLEPEQAALVVRSARAVWVIEGVPDSEPFAIEGAPMGSLLLRRLSDGSTSAEVVR